MISNTGIEIRPVVHDRSSTHCIISISAPLKGRSVEVDVLGIPLWRLEQLLEMTEFLLNKRFSPRKAVLGSFAPIHGSYTLLVGPAYSDLTGRDDVVGDNEPPPEEWADEPHCHDQDSDDGKSEDELMAEEAGLVLM